MALVAVAVSGCAKTQKFDPATVSAAKVTDTLPAPGAGDLLTGRRAYQVGAFDKLSIQIFGVPELDRIVEVDSSGNIALPLIGRVKAVGESTESLGTVIESRYAERYLRNPQVNVTVTQAVSQTVTVDGAVVRPGLYPVSGNSSLMTTIASANGTNDFAKLDEVLVFRTVSEKRMVARYSLAAIRTGVAPDPEIYGNDVVVVGAGPGKLNLRDLILLTPVLGSFYQLTR